MAERLARAYLDDALGASAAAFSVESAGTRAVVGREMEPSSAAALTGLGGDPRGFRARQLTAGMAGAADLLLTMTRQHRRAVLGLAPRALFRTYTLLEAADLLRGVDVTSLPTESASAEQPVGLVRALGAQRATRRRADREQDDVLDPIGRHASVHQDVGELIAAALHPLVQALCVGSGSVGAVEADVTQRILPPASRVA